jgi:hypothetical protein
MSWVWGEPCRPVAVGSERIVLVAQPRLLHTCLTYLSQVVPTLKK